MTSSTIELECPWCGADTPADLAAVLARAEVTCTACGKATDLDPARLEAAEVAAARRTFRSTGPRPTAVRRYRVEVAPLGELPADAPADARRPPFLAAAPALGREPFALGDTAEEAVAALGRIVRLRAEAGRLASPLPPSDADPVLRWVEVSD
jgi:hypothetical protein